MPPPKTSRSFGERHKTEEQRIERDDGRTRTRTLVHAAGVDDQGPRQQSEHESRTARDVTVGACGLASSAWRRSTHPVAAQGAV